MINCCLTRGKIPPLLPCARVDKVLSVVRPTPVPVPRHDERCGTRVGGWVGDLSQQRVHTGVLLPVPPLSIISDSKECWLNKHHKPLSVQAL
jgi:hypothetical protein